MLREYSGPVSSRSYLVVVPLAQLMHTMNQDTIASVTWSVTQRARATSTHSSLTRIFWCAEDGT
jgi:hypothetical protein